MILRIFSGSIKILNPDYKPFKLNIMKIKTQDMPVIMEAPGSIMRAIPNCGGMTMNFNQLSKGTDFTPLLKGLEHDSCHSPHWGYVIEGEIKLKYDDGKEEVVRAGEFYYWPAGHTAIVLEDLKFLEFSPTKEYSEVISHVGKKMEELNV